MSKLIQINDEITQNLLTQGYHIANSSKFSINAKLYGDMTSFIKAYDNLEIDKYVYEKEGLPYRRRRYGSFVLNSENLELSVNEHKAFYQSENVNKSYGGIQRDFAPMTNELLDNTFLKEMIKSDFEKLPRPDKLKSQKWFVGIQMFRIEATKEFSGQATPEGIHQDGHHFIVQHMINKQNIEGGVSTIYNLDKEKIISITLNNFLDSCYIKDEKVMHSVSSIECKNINEIAMRDMLILDFELMEIR